MDYNSELLKAINEANIDIYEKEIFDEYKRECGESNINKQINSIWKEISNNKKIAIATAGVSTTEILNIIGKNREHSMYN